MMAEREKPKIFTFYSYKGGVGRSMAVANAALFLANIHGLKVIAVDWDLEAPGLHYYFQYSDEDLETKKGLLDFFQDFKDEMTKGAKGVIPDVIKYILPLPPLIKGAIKFGSVELLHCGRTDESYPRRIRDFNWPTFYSEFDGYYVVEELKKQLKKSADIILIDSRTGLTDIGGVSAVQVPDVLCLMFTSNQQNLRATVDLVRKLARNPDRQGRGLAPLRILLIPSRIPKDYESELYGDWVKKAENEFNSLIKEGILFPEDYPRGVETCLIPFEARYSYWEHKLAAMEPDIRRGKLSEAFVKLAGAIFNISRGLPAWQEIPFIKERPLAQPEGESLKKIDLLQKDLDEAIIRGDSASIALINESMAIEYLQIYKYDEATLRFTTSLALNREAKNTKGILVSLVGLSIVRVAQKRYDEALAFLEQALEMARKVNDLVGQGVALYQIGMVRIKQERYDDALVLLEQALELAKQDSQLGWQGILLHEMGVVRMKQERYDEAWALFEQALELKRRAGELHLQWETLHDMGFAQYKQKRYDDALALFNQALELSRNAADLSGQIRCLKLMGGVRREQQQYEEALGLLKQVLELSDKVGDLRSYGVTLAEIGITYIETKDYKRAISCFEEGLKIARKAKHEEGEKFNREGLRLARKALKLEK